jgi:hypothetical protein
MAVYNVHTRRLPATQAEVGELIDSLAGGDDRLWPAGSWPPMRFDRPLAVGANGGHGPIRYHVESYVPGHSVRFRFAAPRGFDGFHEFIVIADAPGQVELRHIMALRLRGAAKLIFPLLWRPLHNAALEDSMDRAERAVTGTVRVPARWNGYVRLLRSLLERRRPNAARRMAQSSRISGR